MCDGLVLTVNRDREVGIAAAGGGAGANYGNTAAGSLGDFIPWITGLTDMRAQVSLQPGPDTVL